MDRAIREREVGAARMVARGRQHDVIGPGRCSHKVDDSGSHPNFRLRIDWVEGGEQRVAIDARDPPVPRVEVCRVRQSVNVLAESDRVGQAVGYGRDLHRRDAAGVGIGGPDDGERVDSRHHADVLEHAVHQTELSLVGAGACHREVGPGAQAARIAAIGHGQGAVVVCRGSWKRVAKVDDRAVAGAPEDAQPRAADGRVGVVIDRDREVHRVVDCALFDELRQPDQHAGRIRIAVAVVIRLPTKAHRERAVGAFVVVQCQNDLLEIVRALETSCRLSCRLHGRQEQRDEYRDNRNDNQELDQCEAASGRESRAETTDEAGSDHDNLLVVRSLCEAQRESEESSARSVRVSCRSINRLARKAKSDVQSRRPYSTCRGFIIASTPRPGRTLREPTMGRSSGSRINLQATPSHGFQCPQWPMWRSSPVTAAGPQRICTVFPLLRIWISFPDRHPCRAQSYQDKLGRQATRSFSSRPKAVAISSAQAFRVADMSLARYDKILGSTVRLERRKPIAAETGPLLDQGPAWFVATHGRSRRAEEHAVMRSVGRSS